MHLGGKIEVVSKVAAQNARRSVDGLHAGRRARLRSDPQGPGKGFHADDQEKHGRGRLRRHGGARARRHRPGGGDAGDGRQGDAVQGIRRRRRVSDLSEHERPGRDRRTVKAIAPGVRRHQSRRHFRAALFRDRRAAEGKSSTFRSFTTTSTARRSSCSPR